MLTLKSTAPRGFILILVVVILTMLTMAVSLSLLKTVQNLRQSRLQQQKTKAFYQAEGALAQAKGQLVHGFLDKHDPSFIAFDPLNPTSLFDRYLTDANLTKKLPQHQGGFGTVDYKVLLSQITDIATTTPDDPLFAAQKRQGRRLWLKSQAQHQQGAAATVSQQLVISFLPNIIFKYGMLTNRFKECQFCHMNVNGDIGQVSKSDFAPISPHVIVGHISGDLYLAGQFTLDQHPAHPQQLNIRGQIVEKTTDPDLLPRHWPSILDQSNPRHPEIAGFYVDLVDRAAAKGSAYIDGGEILLSHTQSDRFISSQRLGPVTYENVILTGTDDNPLHLHGPVVIKGDLILHGVVTGQGSIYVERNIYLIGDVRYVHRPTDTEWSNVLAAEQRRRQRLFVADNYQFDKLGLFAGGNVVVGNLAASSTFRYLRYFLNYESSGMPEHQAKNMSATEYFDKHLVYDAFGLYAMDGGSGQRLTDIDSFRYHDPFEDGSDYDHDQNRAWGEGMHWISKKGIELRSTGLLPKGAMIASFDGAWISQNEFDRRARQQQISQLDATIYTDGAFTGYKASNDKGVSEQTEYLLQRDLDGDGLTFHGAIIARDVDVLAPGGWYVQYDNRNYVGQGSAVDFEPSRLVEIGGWQEE